MNIWALVHHLIAHPLRGLTLDSKWAQKFHDWSAAKAWPQEEVR